MKPEIKICWLVLLIHGALTFDLHQEYNGNENLEESTRGRRDVIEEEKYYNMRSDNRQDNMNRSPWLPGVPSEDPTTKISLTKEQDAAFLYQTTETVTDKPTGRGARASNENWIKLPFPTRDDSHRDILTPPQPSGELINSRMPRVNFVTQNKVLEASESRNDKESVQRPTRNDDLRTEFVRPEEDRTQYRPVFPRQAVYYPEDNRRYYDDRYHGADDLYRRDQYTYDRKRYNPGYGPRVDRYDESYDNYVPRKPKRIIYYAHLPDVIRTPPSVDLRYRYSTDPYRRLDEDYYARNGRYDYRFRNRYPNAPSRKDERRFGYRDQAGASTVAKEKKDEKVTPTPILPQKEDKFKSNSNRNPNRNIINSHQYHDTGSNTYNNPSRKTIQDQNLSSNSYLRFEEPLFHSTIEDPYQRKY